MQRKRAPNGSEGEGSAWRVRMRSAASSAGECARADIDVGPRRRCAAAVRSGCARRLGQHSLELGACDFTALFPPLPQEFDLILSTLIIGLHRLVLRDEAQLGLLVF